MSQGQVLFGPGQQLFYRGRGDYNFTLRGRFLKIRPFKPKFKGNPMKPSPLHIAFLFLLAPLAAQALDTPADGTTYSYPLPVKNQSYVNLVYTMASSGTVQATIYNEAGDPVVTFSEPKAAGLQTSSVYLCCLSPGLYLYRLTLQYDSGSTEKLTIGKILVQP
jgi:hypothetical protein